MVHNNPAAAPSTVVELDGPIANDLVDYARHKVDAALRHTGLPVLHSTVVVTRHRDPARSRPVAARANVDLNGRPIRVEVAAGTPREAVDLLVDGLRGQLARLGAGWRYRHTHRDQVRPGDHSSRT